VRDETASAQRCRAQPPCAPLQQQTRPRHFSAQFFASTARKTATSLTAARASGAGAREAPSSTSIAAHALPLIRGGAAAAAMRLARMRAGGRRV